MKPREDPVANDERSGDDLFEDLDKFFAPIKDVDWDEPGGEQAGTTPQEEHVAVRHEGTGVPAGHEGALPAESATSPAAASRSDALEDAVDERVEPGDDDDESWYDTGVLETVAELSIDDDDDPVFADDTVRIVDDAPPSMTQPMNRPMHRPMIKPVCSTRPASVIPRLPRARRARTTSRRRRNTSPARSGRSATTRPRSRATSRAPRSIPMRGPRERSTRGSTTMRDLPPALICFRISAPRRSKPTSSPISSPNLRTPSWWAPRASAGRAGRSRPRSRWEPTSSGVGRIGRTRRARRVHDRRGPRRGRARLTPRRRDGIRDHRGARRARRARRAVRRDDEAPSAARDLRRPRGRPAGDLGHVLPRRAVDPGDDGARA